MSFVRKCVVLISVLAIACFAVSPQAVVNVWGYKAVRAFYIGPFTAVMNVAGAHVAEADSDIVRALIDETLLILDDELEFRPQRSIRVLVDDRLTSRGISGSYQLGTIAVASPSRGTFDQNSLKGTLLHEMTHLAVDYLAHGNYPGWLTEGLAIYLEVRHSGATWIDLRLARTWSKIEDVEAALNSQSLDEQAAAYWQSYIMVSYLYEQGGSESITFLLSELGRGETMRNSLKKAYSIDIDDLDRDALVSFLARQEAVE